MGSVKTSRRLAIVAGRGDLPRLLAEECKATGRDYIVVEFENIPLSWAASHPRIPAIFEKIGHLFTQLQGGGFGAVVMAGAMDRAQIDLQRLDDKGVELATIISSTVAAGDNATLTAIIQFFEANEFEVIPAHEVMPSLIPNAGVLSKTRPNVDDETDTARAAEIVEALGRVDVGQGAVVAKGICLGLESIQGTDAMLEFVHYSREKYSINPDGGQGVLLKAPKPGQDFRVDLPTIGPSTITNAHAAGLAGIVIESGGAILLHKEDTIALANKLGLFIWVRPKHG